MDIKDSASEGSEEVRSMAEKMQVISENFQIIMHRLLIEIWAFKSLLLRPQKEMRKMLSESERKEILVT